MKSLPKNKTKKVFIVLIIIVLSLCVVGVTAVFGVSAYVKGSVKKNILPVANITQTDYDCILVLGCGLRPNGTPSDMLEDRILCGVEAYKLGLSAKILMSGDHGQEDYNEVSAMKNYAMQADVPSEDIFMDHAGFSTYESIYRARDVFGAEKILIVTQKYHLSRALYIARQLGVEAVGISASLRQYTGQLKADMREVLARDKDFVYCIIKPEPTYMGEKISLLGSGDSTND